MTDPTLDQRLDALEAKLGRLEAMLGTLSERLGAGSGLEAAKAGIQAWVTEYVSLRLQQLVPEIGRRRVGKECRSRWSPYH